MTDPLAFLSGGGEAERMIRSRDWSGHPLGAPETWPAELRSALSLVLNSPESMILAWGPELSFFFNETYFPLLGPRLPWAMGERFDVVWADAWDQAKPIIDEAMAGRSRHFDDLPWKLGTDRGARDTWFSFSYSRVLDGAGAVAGLFVFTNETTKRVLAEQGRKGDEHRNRQILDSAVDFAVVATDTDGLVTRWSEGAHRVLGWSEAEMLGHTVSRFFTPEDRAADRPGVEMRGALSDGQASNERWHLRKDGTRFFASGEMQPLRDAEGGHLGFVKVLRDRTEQHRAGEALREAEARLRESEDHYRHAVELSPQVAWTCDPQGSITSYSPRWLELTGQAPGEPLGAGWAGALHPNDVPHTMAAFSACLASGEPVDVDYRLRHVATGEVRWVRARASPRRDEAGTIVRWYGVVEDVHDRKLAEAHLRESEARFRAFAQAMPNHVWSATPDGGLDWVNDQVLSFSGLTTEESLGNRWIGIVHPEDLPDAGRRWAAALASGEVYQTEFRLRRADGTYRWHLARAVPIRDADGAIAHWIGTNTDIEDQRAAADTLAQVNATLEEQVEERTRERDRLWLNTQDIQVVIDGDGVFREVNPAFSRILGWSPEDVLGHAVFKFIVPEDEGMTQGALEHARTDALPTVENRYRHKDGGFRWISWVAAPEGGLIYASGRHITAEKEQAQALAQAEEALRQSQKMEAVGQLTGGLAHDFNNLLAGISGALELMGTRMAQGRLDDVERYIVAAQGASKRAAALTHRLLAFSRRQTLDPKPTNVNRLVSGIEELIRRTIGPSVALEVVGASGLWPTLIDPSQLENALLNLCINARDAMPEGGRITVETANKWLDEHAARKHDMPPGQYLSVCVTDTGTGMPPDVIARAFDPFFTTKPIGQGTGLGLSMIYGFARQSGGQVRIYSEVGQGTTVCLYLPRHHGEGEADEELAPVGKAAPAEQGETVLVVDDEAMIRMLLVDELQGLGYATIEAADSATGLKVLQSDRRVDLLVTDVGLPGGMNGRQMADAGRATRPSLKVLFITGYAENAVMGNGQLGPGLQVITKPFVVEVLIAKVREMITAG